jgi:hypothetical protein
MHGYQALYKSNVMAGLYRSIDRVACKVAISRFGGFYTIQSHTHLQTRTCNPRAYMCVGWMRVLAFKHVMQVFGLLQCCCRRIIMHWCLLIRMERHGSCRGKAQSSCGQSHALSRRHHSSRAHSLQSRTHYSHCHAFVVQQRGEQHLPCEAVSFNIHRLIMTESVIYSTSRLIVCTTQTHQAKHHRWLVDWLVGWLILFSSLGMHVAYLIGVAFDYESFGL